MFLIPMNLKSDGEKKDFEYFSDEKHQILCTSKTLDLCFKF
jgi:hypothetical protein